MSASEPVDPAGRRSASRPFLPAEVWVGLAVSGLGLALLTGLPLIGVGAGYDRIGPRFFPSLVAAASLAIGVWLLVTGVRPARVRARARGAETGAGSAAPDWPPLAYLGLAFVLALALFERAGFVPAASVQFWLVARALGSRRPARDAAVAVALSLAVYLLFSRGLGLSLPAGVLDGVL